MHTLRLPAVLILDAHCRHGTSKLKQTIMPNLNDTVTLQKRQARQNSFHNFHALVICQSPLPTTPSSLTGTLSSAPSSVALCCQAVRGPCSLSSLDKCLASTFGSSSSPLPPRARPARP